MNLALTDVERYGDGIPYPRTIYVMPPYCITPDELARIWEVIAVSLDAC